MWKTNLFGAQAAPAPVNDTDRVTAGDDTVDPLLICLEEIAQHYERSIAREALTAGLPLVEGRLTPRLVAEAAERASLSARIVKRPLSQITELLLPAILLLQDNSAVLVVERTKKTARVLFPETGKGVETVRLDALNAQYTGRAILVKPSYDALEPEGHKTPRRAKSWFWSSVAPLWPSYIQVIVAAALVNVLALAAPLFIMNVYDRVLPNKALTTLWVLAAGVGLAIFFDFVFRTLRNALIGNAGRRADVLLASKIFQHVMSLDMGCRPSNSGEYIHHLRDYEFVREYFTSNTIVTITDLLFTGLFIFIIYQIAGLVAYVPAAAVLLVLLIGLIMQVPIGFIVARAQREAAHRHSILFESVAGLETIKNCNAEGQMMRQWELFVGQNSKTADRLRFVSALSMNMTSLVQQLVTVGVVVVGVYLFDKGDISPGALIASVILSGRAVAPLGQLAGALSRSQQAISALRVLNNVMREAEEGDQQHRYIDKSIQLGTVSFKKAGFTYPGSEAPSLQDLSLNIRHGEKVGIIGKIGSGKTTLGRLISRLYLPTEGVLLLDGVDVRQYHPAGVRRQVAFVTQDSMLFHGSIRHNITLGMPHVSDEQLVRAAEVSGVADFVNAHPHGFNRDVGEGGRCLSNGQRQAVVLARAFLLQPKIIFLDDPTGLMDTVSEKAVVERLRGAFTSDQTLIVTTHRSSVLSLVSRLIVLDGGRVIADGPKEKVLDLLAGKNPPNG